MNPDTPMAHPEEQLSAYVDGSATPPEREAVEAHLAECALCREELELSRSARAALSALPQLEAPGLAADGLPALRGTLEPTPIRAPRAKSWERLAWGAGLAAAAAIAAMFLIMGGFLSDRNGDVPASLSETPAAEQPELFQGGEHTAESLASLARTLAADTRSMEDSGGERALSGAEASPPPAGATPAATVEEIVACLRRGAGLGSDVQPSYLEQATFQGTPAYIGAFVIPRTGDSPGHLQLVAVSRDECDPLYFVRESL